MRPRAPSLVLRLLPLLPLLTSALAARAQPTATPFWRSGFETGFPGEWLDYDNGSFTPTGVPNSGFNEAWTIVDRTQFADVFAGDHAYKGWLLAAQADSHRAYPVLHTDVPSPLVNSFMVWLDIDYDQLSVTDWVHFATWGNNPDWAVHTMSVRDRKLEMAHLSWSYVGPSPQPDFPLRQWVRFTAYIDYAGAAGTIRVWQDGVAVLEGTYTTVAGTSLQRAHWGMYSSGSITQGVQYNDEIQLWTLDGPWTDLDVEPPSPYATPQQDGGTPTDGPAPSDGATPADGASPADGAAPLDAPAGTDGAAPADAAGDTGTAGRTTGGCGCHTAPPVRDGVLLSVAALLGALRTRRRRP